MIFVERLYGHGLGFHDFCSTSSPYISAVDTMSNLTMYNAIPLDVLTSSYIVIWASSRVIVTHSHSQLSQGTRWHIIAYYHHVGLYRG